MIYHAFILNEFALKGIAIVCFTLIAFSLSLLAYKAMK